MGVFIEISDSVVPVVQQTAQTFVPQAWVPQGAAAVVPSPTDLTATPVADGVIVSWVLGATGLTTIVESGPSSSGPWTVAARSGDTTVTIGLTAAAYIRATHESNGIQSAPTLAVLATPVDVSKALQDASNALAAADGEVKFTKASTAPTVGNNYGDIWQDSDDGAIYRWLDVDGNGSFQWEPRPNDALALAIIAAAGAQGTADGKVRLVFSESAPTGWVAGDEGDQWFKLSTKQLSVWNGSAFLASQDYDAQSKLSDIASDGKLTANEKITAKREYDQIIAEQSGIDTQASGLGITTEKTAYDNAVTALKTYLRASPRILLDASYVWTSITGTTDVVRADWDSAWKLVYSTKQTLLNKIADVIKTNAAADATAKANAARDAAVSQAATSAAGIYATQTALLAETNNRNTAITNKATELVNDYTAKFTTERNTTVAEIQAEANARGGAIAQAKTDILTELESVEQASIQRDNQISAGLGNQFNPVIRWEFAVDAEGWQDGYGNTPLVANSYLQVDPTTANEYVYSPPIEFDAILNRSVAARIKKVGNPVWRGQIYTHALANPIASIPEPTFDTNGNTVATWDDIPWANPVTQLLVALPVASSTDANNFYSIDWIAIGSPTPAAGVAYVRSVEQASINRDQAEASARQSMGVQFNTDLATTNASIDTLRQTTSDANSARAAEISQLNADVETEKGRVTGALTRIGSVETAVDEVTGDVHSISETVQLHTASILDVDGKATNTANALAATQATVSSQGGVIESHTSDLTALNATVFDPVYGVTAMGNAIDETRIDISTLKSPAANGVSDPYFQTSAWDNASNHGYVADGYFGRALVMPASSGLKWWTYDAPVNAGLGYTLSGDVYRDNLDGSAFYNVEYLDANKSHVAWGLIVGAFVAGDWVRISCYEIAPPGSVWKRIYCETADTTGSSYFNKLANKAGYDDTFSDDSLVRANLSRVQSLEYEVNDPNGKLAKKASITSLQTIDDEVDALGQTVSTNVSQLNALNLAVGGVNSAVISESSLTYKQGVLEATKVEFLKVGNTVAGWRAATTDTFSSFQMQFDSVELLTGTNTGVSITKNKMDRVFGNAAFYEGDPFGSDSLVFWIGPKSIAKSGATKANGTFWISSAGDRGGGAIIGKFGTSRATATSSTPNGTVEVSTGNFERSSSHAQITVSVGMFAFRTSSGTGTNSTTAQSVSGVIEKSVDGGAWTQVGGWSARGSYNVEYDSGVKSETSEVSGGGYAADTTSGTNIAYRARRTGGSVNLVSGVANNMTITITVEQV